MRLLLALTASLVACTIAPPVVANGDDPSTAEIIALERGALDRWGNGDPRGYLSIMEPEITYFDPFTDLRLDGLASTTAYITPFTGKIHIDRYEMINPRVQRGGDLAILTFNLVDEVKAAGKTMHWNSTEVYRHTRRGWRIVHSHWSLVKPDIKSATN